MASRAMTEHGNTQPSRDPMMLRLGMVGNGADGAGVSVFFWGGKDLGCESGCVKPFECSGCHQVGWSYVIYGLLVDLGQFGVIGAKTDSSGFYSQSIVLHCFGGYPLVI